MEEPRPSTSAAGGSSLAAFAALIHSEIGSWDNPAVELGIFGTREPVAIAAQFDAFCVAHFGAPIAVPLFYSSSIGAVAGARLADCRQVVVKAHQPDVLVAYLSVVDGVRRHLAAQAFPCPKPLLGPVPLGAGHATVEEHDDEGEYRNAHEPPVRRALAQTLARLAELAQPFAGDPILLAAGRARRPPRDRLWVKPHSVIFDFEATVAGAEWIDDFARRARRLLDAGGDVGEVVVGHNDWSMRQMRFLGDTVHVVYDWDSLIAEREPIVVGRAAKSFTMTYGTPLHGTVPVAPAFDEIFAFVRDYESARHKRFSAAERRLLGASAAYSLAYTCRCGHAFAPRKDPDAAFPPGSYPAALSEYVDRLLAL